MVDQKDIEQYNTLARQYQIVALERQKFELQVKEIESSIEELKKSNGKTYLSIGRVVVEKPKDEIIDELTKQKKDLSDKFESMKIQEGKLKAKLEELDKKLASESNAQLGGTTE